ncbi:MAG: hypothetical protein HRF49_07170, partial [bacterium]
MEASNLRKNYEVDVELLIPSGGGRTYSYFCPFRDEPPSKGEVVVVPFRNKPTPALVLASRQPLPLLERRRLRPLLGIERTDAVIKKLGRIAISIATANLKNFRDAASMLLPAPPEREISVFFFARPARMNLSCALV